MLTQCQYKLIVLEVRDIKTKKNIGSVLALYPTPVTVICAIDNTYNNEKHLSNKGKVNYETLKPVLFEFPTYQYLKTGEVIGKYLSFKKVPEE